MPKVTIVYYGFVIPKMKRVEKTLIKWLGRDYSDD
jgi:hypothetical protein